VADPDATFPQRAAHVTYHLVLRALAGMDGLTTGQVADMLGLTWGGAAVLMGKLQATDGVPIVRVGGQWIVLRDQLIADAAGQ
jgi:hypothetical protein